MVVCQHQCWCFPWQELLPGVLWPLATPVATALMMQQRVSDTSNTRDVWELMRERVREM